MNRVRLNYLITYIAEGFIFLSGLFIYNIIATRLGATAFAEYIIAGKIVAILQPIAMLGLGVGIPRFTAIRQAQCEEKNGVDNYFVGGLAWLLTVTPIMFAGAVLFPETFSKVFFGSSQHVSLFLPMMIWLIGILLHAMSYSYFRGRLQMWQANALNVWGSAFGPLISVLLFGTTVPMLLTANGVLLSIGAVLFLALTVNKFDINQCRMGVDVRELLKYSIPRVPGDLALAALYSLPTIFAAHMLGIQQAGMVGFGSSVLTKIMTMFAPISVIMMPEISGFLARRDTELVQRRTLQILISALVILTVVVMGLVTLAPFVVSVLLGSDYSDYVWYLRLVVIAIIPLALFTVLRNVIDAYYTLPVNAKNIIISLLAQLSLAVLVRFLRKNDPAWVLVMQILPAFLLGTLTIVSVRSIFREFSMK